MRERKNNFFAKLDAVLNPPADPGQTAKEIAKRYGWTHDVATGRLKRLVAKGVLIEGRRRGDNGRIENVYRCPEP